MREENKKRFEDATNQVDDLPSEPPVSVPKTSNHDHDSTFYDAVFALIPKGKKEAVSMHTLASILGIDDRQCRKLVQKMREAGYLIIGDVHGYYQPVNNDDAYRWQQQVHRRAMTALSSLKAVNRLLKGNGIETDDLITDLDNLKKRIQAKEENTHE